MGCTDLDFRNFYVGSVFTFPNKVIGSRDLIRLSAFGCKIDLGEEGKVSCSRLKSHSFENVYLKDNDTIRNIILRCPLIEDLSLSFCKVMPETQDPASIVLNTRNVVLSAFIGSGKRNVGSVVGGLSIQHVFHKLKSLFLSRIDVDKLFFKDFSSKFPCLKDLAIHNCGGYERIQILSPTLEWIDFAQDMNMLRAKFDVPKIREFTFRGSNFPELFYKTASSDWMLGICIRRCSPPSPLWFLKLNKLLTNLSQSKVSLFLKIQSAKNFCCIGKLQGLPKSEVENLKLDVPCSFYPSLFYFLLRCCRPIYVTQFVFPKSDFLEFVYKKLVQQAGSNCCIANQSMHGKFNLEGVVVEFCDGAISASDALKSTEAQQQRIHFMRQADFNILPSLLHMPSLLKLCEELRTSSSFLNLPQSLSIKYLIGPTHQKFLISPPAKLFGFLKRSINTCYLLERCFLVPLFSSISFINVCKFHIDCVFLVWREHRKYLKNMRKLFDDSREKVAKSSELQNNFKWGFGLMRTYQIHPKMINMARNIRERRRKICKIRINSSARKR